MATNFFTIPPADKPGLQDVPPFIADDANRLADRAVKAFLRSASPKQNPLVLYGATGVGKSHLARNIATWFENENPNSRVFIISGSDFARAYANAVDTKSVDEMQEKFRRVDFLVIDGLESLSTKRPAQEELVRTLDALLENHGRVLATCNSLPVDIKNMSPQLAGRFSGGVAVCVQPPNLAARQEMIRRIAVENHLALEQDAIEALSRNLEGNFLQYQHALLQTEHEFASGNTITAADIAKFLEHESNENSVTLRVITSKVSGRFQLKSADLKGPTRKQAVVRARGVAMYIARQLTGKSLQQVGKHFGGRDHTTVLHACRKTESLLKTDPEIRTAVEELTAQLK